MNPKFIEKKREEKTSARHSIIKSLKASDKKKILRIVCDEKIHCVQNNENNRCRLLVGNTASQK